MLPTPLARDWHTPTPTRRPPTSRVAGSLPDTVIRLLPTPVARDLHGGQPPAQRLAHRRQVNLRDVATQLPATPPTAPDPPGSVLRLLPTPAARNPNDGEDPSGWLARQARHRARGINGNGMGMPLSVAIRLLPTPLATEATHGSPNQHSSSGQPGLTATVLRLLPTPRAAGNRNSRTALMVHRSGPGLEQAVEISLGILPTELTGLAGQTPPSWHTRPPTTRRAG
ncbi:MAG TPA: hypothetical protein VMU51_11010 [Mycobacteriales bacterium]|nr:hypothetical protein [Mycobacteriales bacterium]